MRQKVEIPNFSVEPFHQRARRRVRRSVIAFTIYMQTTPDMRDGFWDQKKLFRYIKDRVKQKVGKNHS